MKDKIDDCSVQTSDDKELIGCGAYDYENGYCKDTNEPCDMCFANDLTV